MTEGIHSTKTVLLVDDNPFNREGLALYLQSQGYETLEAGDQRSALELAASHRPDEAIVDIVIPATPYGLAEMHLSLGLEVVRLLKQMDPGMGIVVFSAHEDRGADVWAMVQDGMRGIAYLLKGSRPERILNALEETAAGHVLLEPDVMRSSNQLAHEMRSRLSPEERPWVERAVDLLPTLTPRELDVASRISASHTTQSIADTLGLAPRTVEHYTVAVYSKLGFDAIDAKAPTLRKATLLAKAFILYQLSRS